jgi:hypothetical protein
MDLLKQKDKQLGLAIGLANEEQVETRNLLKENDEELTRVTAKMGEVIKVDPNQQEETREKLDQAGKKILQVTHIISSSMEELLAKRNLRRELEKHLEKVEVAWASEKSQSIEKFRAELAVASGENISPFVASAVETPRGITMNKTAL